MEQELFEGLHKNRCWGAGGRLPRESVPQLVSQLPAGRGRRRRRVPAALRLEGSPGRPEKRQRGPWGGLSRAAFRKDFGPSTSRASSPIPALRTCPRPRWGRATGYLVGEVKRLPARPAPPVLAVCLRRPGRLPSWLPSPGRTARSWPSASPKGRSSWPSAAPPGPSPSGRPMCAFPPSSGTRAAMASKRHGCPCLCCMSSGRSWACLSSPPPRSGPKSPGPPSASRFWA